MDTHKQGWFTETWSVSGPGKGVATSIKVKQVLFKQRSAYQEVCVVQSETFGKCLILDNAIQCTDMDEFSYQEMIAFLPLNAHPNPSRVLIVGGGDGGVARECLKHPSIKRLYQCELDPLVVEISRKYFPQMASAFDDSKLELIFSDGYKYVEQLPDSCLDVIIVDSTDPEGPAESLYSIQFYELVHRKLAPDGLMCCQAQSIWFELDLIEKLINFNSGLFGQVAYATCLSCTYPSGQIGFLICAKSKKFDIRKARQSLDDDDGEEQANYDESQKGQGKIKGPCKYNIEGLKYYSAQVHEAAFVLPRFAQTRLYKKKIKE